MSNDKKKYKKSINIKQITFEDFKRSDKFPEDLDVEEYVEEHNNLLTGSDTIIFLKEEKDEEIIKKPIELKILDWIKNNQIVTGLIVLAIGSIISFVLITSNQLSAIDAKIQSIQQQVSALEDTYVDKDALQAQLDLVRADIKNKYDLELNDIQWRLNNIEKELDEALSKE